MIMFVSLFFSVVIYANVDKELTRLENVQQIAHDRAEQYFGYAAPAKVTTIIESGFIDEARKGLLSDLAILNVSILFLSAWVGFFLAGRTLNPIKQMIDNQSRFLADASHELKTPLTSLRTENEIFLRSKKKTLKSSEEILKSNLEEVIRLQNLTNNLMELSTLEKAAGKIPFERLNLERVIDNAVLKVSKLAKDKNVSIVKKGKKIFLLGNEKSLEELLVILLDNAIKFSKNNTKVNIAGSLRDKMVFVKIEDQGIGISEGDLEHIFDRFFRADKSRNTSKTPGFGLGLSIAREIVSLHGGQIYAKSSKKGSTFTVELPKT